MKLFSRQAVDKLFFGQTSHERTRQKSQLEVGNRLEEKIITALTNAIKDMSTTTHVKHITSSTMFKLRLVGLLGVDDKTEELTRKINAPSDFEIASPILSGAALGEVHSDPVKHEAYNQSLEEYRKQLEINCKFVRSAAIEILQMGIGVLKDDLYAGEAKRLLEELDAPPPAHLAPAKFTPRPPRGAD
jgi:hypothetical protein